MVRSLLLVALLLVTGAAAQLPSQADPQAVHDGPGLAVLVVHPYPDPADPLGFPFPENGSRDAYMQRHRHLDTEGDGFDFPHVVVDGLLAVEGLPAGQDVVGTQDAYARAVAARRDIPTPLVLETATMVLDDRLHFRGWMASETDLPGEALHAWAGLVEDPVHFQPPAEISNGVFDHPFTLRALTDLGVVDLSSAGTLERNATWRLDPDWDPEHLRVVFWVEQEGRDGPRFAAHEVIQATLHDVARGGITRQEARGVLLEMYSATWCDPCLFGDRAVEDLAAQAGIDVVRSASARYTYFTPTRTAAWAGAIGLLAGAALLMVRLPGEPRPDDSPDDAGGKTP